MPRDEPPTCEPPNMPGRKKLAAPNALPPEGPEPNKLPVCPNGTGGLIADPPSPAEPCW